MTYQLSGQWIVTPAARPDAKMRLVCFPFAGGSAAFYNEWQKHIPRHIEVSAVELPGRGMRFGESLRYHMTSIAEPIVELLKALSDKPYVIFGHSMGSLIGYEISRRMQALGKGPLALLASGRRAPCVPLSDPPLHTLDDHALVRRLGEYNGTPAEVLNDPDMRGLFLPIIRADLQINDTYAQGADSSLKCPIYAFAGEDDPEAPPVMVERWSAMTSGEFSMNRFKGGHFFLKEKQQDFMERLNSRLENICENIQ